MYRRQNEAFPKALDQQEDATMKELPPHMRGTTLLLTRLMVVVIFFYHGIPKAFNPGMAMEKFIGMGLSGALGPVIGWLEVIAALFVLVGFLHRWANLSLAVIIIGALVTVQIPGGFTAGLERDMLILAATLLLSVHGPGLFAIDNMRTSQTELTDPTMQPASKNV
jgi:putative oxidoreductase